MKTILILATIAGALALALPAAIYTHAEKPATPAAPPSETSLIADSPAAEEGSPLSPRWGTALAALLCGSLLLGSIRTIRDADLIKSVALPAAGATAVTPSIRLDTGPHVERFEGLLSIPATPALVDAKTVTVTMQHSDDDVTFTAIPELATLVVTGAGGAGAAASERSFRFPGDVKKFVRASAAVQAAGGDNTAVLLSFSLLA